MALSDDLVEATRKAQALEAAVETSEASNRQLIADLDAARALVARLEAELAACKDAGSDDLLVGISPGVTGSADSIKAMLDGMREVGFRAFRYDVNRAATEPRKGEYHFDRHRNIAVWCYEREIVPLPMPTYAPPWDRQRTSPKFTDGPSDLDALEAYGAAFSDAFADVHPSPDEDVAEWWNEADTVHFWTPAPNPERYMLTAYRFQRGRLKSNPKAKLVLSGLAPAPDKAPQINPATFVQRCYDAVGKGDLANVRSRFWHGVGFHPYMGGHPPETQAPWSTMGTIWDRIETTIRSRFTADPLPLIYSTEWGYATRDDKVPSKAVTEDEQADYIIRQIELFRERPIAGPCHLHRWQDFPHGKYPGIDWYNETLGIHTSDGKPKKAVAALREYLNG
jgi:hypothetical protein